MWNDFYNFFSFSSLSLSLSLSLPLSLSPCSVPRPNLYVHLTPVHATLHQTSLVWIMDFLHGVLATVNLDLALSVHSEGKAFMVRREREREWRETRE